VSTRAEHHRLVTKRAPCSVSAVVVTVVPFDAVKCQESWII